MRVKALFTFLLIISFRLCHAQKGIEKLSAHKIDSLQHIRVDTLLYYCSYCGECDVLGRKHNCYMASGYIVSNNFIIYQQQGKFYLLDFDCYNFYTKKQLENIKSISYFCSIIPTLYARDKFFKDQWKKGLFPRPSIADGSFEDAEIVVNKKKHYISMAEAEKTDLRDTDKSHYWVNKEIKLLKLVEEDLAVNKAN